MPIPQATSLSRSGLFCFLRINLSFFWLLPYFSYFPPFLYVLHANSLDHGDLCYLVETRVESTRRALHKRPNRSNSSMNGKVKLNNSRASNEQIEQSELDSVFSWCINRSKFRLFFRPRKVVAGKLMGLCSLRTYTVIVPDYVIL